jgi:hypothetical protein
MTKRTHGFEGSGQRNQAAVISSGNRAIEPLAAEINPGMRGRSGKTAAQKSSPH